MDKLQQQVREMHKLFDQPTSPAEPQLRMAEMRAAIEIEEAFETVCALVGTARAQTIAQAQIAIVLQEKARKGQHEPDLIEAIDGCIDTLVVTYGTLEAIGVDAEPFFDEVMRANLAKAGGPIREDGKRLRPPGWTPPDIEGVLARTLELRQQDRHAFRVALADRYIQKRINGIGFKPSRGEFKLIALRGFGIGDQGIGAMTVEEFDAWAADREWTP